GRGNGIGPAKAKKLVDQFGVDEVLKVCRTDPAYVSVIAGIDLESANRLALKLESLKATEGAKLELDKLLTGRGFPKSLVGKLI
ncbi:helix-hairpin-helix domain-containing protein, partial [Lacticaseibacillus paracasei]